MKSIGSGRQQPPRAPLSIQGFGGKPLISLLHQRHHQPHQHLPPPSNVITLSSFFGFCAVCVVESKCLSKMHLAQHGVLAAGVCGEIWSLRRLESSDHPLFRKIEKKIQNFNAFSCCCCFGFLLMPFKPNFGGAQASISRHTVAQNPKIVQFEEANC